MFQVYSVRTTWKCKIAALTLLFSLLWGSILKSQADGRLPFAGLVEDRNHHGIFYGTTINGGTYGFGTVYKLNTTVIPKTVTIIHSFTYNMGANYYHPEGATPYAGLIQASDGYFYGTTSTGGGSNQGTTYKIDTSGNVTTLHSFSASVTITGYQPVCKLLQASDGYFYGKTQLGGVNNYGTIFKMDSSGNVTPIHAFTGSDGTGDNSELVEDTNNHGILYGGCSGGGAHSNGLIYSVTTSGTLTDRYDFPNAPGSGPTNGGPTSGLCQVGTNFYGTNGQRYSYGTAFEFTPPSTCSIIHTFYASTGDAANPFATLILAGGYLYGTSSTGGTSNIGTLYKMDTSGNVTVLFSFPINYIDGTSPEAPLCLGSDGLFYGTTVNGGTSSGPHAAGYGTVFQYAPFLTLYSFQ